MSDETPVTPQLVDAIQSEIDDQSGGGIPTAYVLVAAYIDSEGRQRWLDRSMEDQGIFATLGMVRFYERLTEDDIMQRATGHDR